MNPTILIIDDDEKLNQLLKGFLSDFGFKTLTAVHPEQGLKKLKHKSPDLVILDVMLPSMDGFEVCKKIRRSSSITIIMLTARGELMDKVVGLELGADDFIVKPVAPVTVLKRVDRAFKRRTAMASQPQTHDQGDLDVIEL